MSVKPDPAAAACYLSVRSNQDGLVFYCICGAVDDGVNAFGDLLCCFCGGIEECLIAAIWKCLLSLERIPRYHCNAWDLQWPLEKKNRWNQDEVHGLLYGGLFIILPSYDCIL